MADLNAINLEITGTSESAQSAVKSTAEALQGLKAMAAGLSGIQIPSDSIKNITAISNAMTGIATAAAAFKSTGNGGFSGLNGFATAVTDLANACKSLTDKDVLRLQTVANAMNAAVNANNQPGGSAAAVQSLTDGVKATKKSPGGSRSSASFGDIGKGIGAFAKKNIETIGKLGNAFKRSSLFSSDFVRSLARIAKYRILRTILSSITKGATEGMKNLARASSEAKATLSQLSSGALTLKNSMGGALYSVLASIVGVLNTIMSAAANAMNWISMLFSILGGRATYKKATTATKEYGDALGGAAGGAKALKQELMGFDEINSLSPDSGGGGGGGGGGLDYGGMFEETPIDESLAEMVDKADFTLLGEKVAEKINTALSNIDWNKIQTGASKLASSLATFINGWVSKIDAETVGDAIAGVVNTALTFVNDFAYTVDWVGLGDKIKQFILNAIKSIKKEQLGKALAAKINIILGAVAGLLPSTYEEWKTVTDWVAGAINAAVLNINKTNLATIIAGVIRGALSLVTSLGQSGAFSNLVSLVTGAITDALNSITEEEIEAAVNAVASEAWKVIRLLGKFVIDITEIALNMDSPIVKGLSMTAIFLVLKKALGAMGINGFTPGKTLALAGALTASLRVLVGIKDIIESVQSGGGVDAKKVVNVVASAFEAAGFFLMSTGNVYAGLVVLGIGVAIELFASIKELRNSESLLPEGAFETGVRGAVDLSEMETAIEMLTEIGGVVSDELSVLEAARAKAAEIAGNTVTATQEVNRLLEVAIYGSAEQATTALTTLSELGVIAIDAEGKISPVVDKLTELGIVAKEGAFGGLANGAEAVTNAVNSVVASVESVSAEVETLSTEVEAVGNVKVGNPFGEMDTTGTSSIETSVSELGTTMQATGEHAEKLREKIVEIPSDIVYNLELNNYDAVMKDLDGLESKITSAGTDGVSGFKAAFDGVGSWISENVATPISNAFNVSLYTYGRKMMTTLKTGLKSISLPKFSITWTNNTSYADVMGQQQAITIPTPTIKFYARGGFPNAGELFVANEAGPEMIGRIGNRPAVANQEQIGDAIFKYMDAHSGANNNIDPNVLAGAIVGALKSAGMGAVYLDGRMLANSINKEARRSGKPAINY